jgi:hypothetical protein
LVSELVIAVNKDHIPPVDWFEMDTACVALAPFTAKYSKKKNPFYSKTKGI